MRDAMHPVRSPGPTLALSDGTTPIRAPGTPKLRERTHDYDENPEGAAWAARRDDAGSSHRPGDSGVHPPDESESIDRPFRSRCSVGCASFWFLTRSGASVESLCEPDRDVSPRPTMGSRLGSTHWRRVVMIPKDRIPATNPTADGRNVEGVMQSTFREELASLRIERPEPAYSGRRRPDRPSPAARRGGGILRLFSWLLWLIPLGLLGVAGSFAYQQYDQIRSRPEVTMGLVQRMTSGEADKLLSAKGYLKSRSQAMIGTKIPGRVERMCVHEGMKVKKGDVLAVIEHKEMNALLASREAQRLKNLAELDEAKADLWEKEREEARVTRLHNQEKVTQEEYEKAVAGLNKAKARVAAIEASIKLTEANIREIASTIASMSLYAPFDGTVVEKQGEEGEVITPIGHELLAGPVGGRHDRRPRPHGRRDRHLREPALEDRGRPAGRGLRQRGAVEALPGPAAPDHSRWATGPGAP